MTRSASLPRASVGSNGSSGAAVTFPICRERPNGNAALLAELAGQRVGAGGAALDNFGDGVVAMDFAEARGERRDIIELTTSTDKNLHRAPSKRPFPAVRPLRPHLLFIGHFYPVAL